MYQVIFKSSGRKVKADGGKTILQAALEAGVAIDAPCGGNKTCGKCKVKIEEGFFEFYGIHSRMNNLSPVSKKEKMLLGVRDLEDSYRLACCTQIWGDVLVFVPAQSPGNEQVILETGKEKTVQLNPAVKKYYVELEKPTLEDYRDDFSRLKDELSRRYFMEKELSIDYAALLKLPLALRKGAWKVTVALLDGREIIDVEPGCEEKAYGIAMDIGTTTIAACLCDLTTGEVIRRNSSLNPQVRYGDDVISRISYCMMNPDGLEKLHTLILEQINALTEELAQSSGARTGHIYEMVLVFNTAMHHLAINIDPQYMGKSPFPCVIRQAVDIKARDLGIGICAGGNIHCLPIEAGFVGADNVSVLISEEPHKQDKMLLVIDIGTNGEIVLGNKDGLMSTSCATGPALEGAQIKFGMRAASGAIEGVRIDPVTFEPELKVIGEKPGSAPEGKAIAKGICGSGIIDAVAGLFMAGIIDRDGKFNKSLDSSRVRTGMDGKMEYVLVWADETASNVDITITQKDVRAVQLAKSALYAGAKILMKKLCVDNVDGVVLAGAFGSYINKKSAMLIGMFPDCHPDNVIAVGNAAGEGAKLALLDKHKRTEAIETARVVRFVEPAVESGFHKEFNDAMYFPHAKDTFPHVEELIKKNIADK